MISGSRHHPPARIIADGAEHTRSSRSRPRTVPTHLGCSSRRLSRRWRRTTRSWAWRRLRRETGGFRYRSDASSSSAARPIKHGMSGVGCTLEGLARSVCKCRWHRLRNASDNRSKIGACGGFYGAGLGDVTRNTEFQYYLTNRELSQSLACSPCRSGRKPPKTRPKSACFPARRCCRHFGTSPSCPAHTQQKQLEPWLNGRHLIRLDVA
jgi:hypothetical protein